MKKRIISILLTACMITALLPVMGNGVFAAGGLTRAEWITQLVTAFEMTVEDDSNMPDNYFSDISEDDSYYRDILLAVEFGVIDLEAGEAFEPNEPATREFTARSLNACLKYQLDEGTEYTFSESETVTYPDDIQVAINRGWFTLSGGNFLPEQTVTSAEAEAMLADAKAVIADDVVDENYNSQYEFADGVIVVPETADVTIEGEYIVTIANWDGTINTDDIFVVYSYGIPVPLKAETVETGEEIVITATKEGAEDAIVSSDAQGSIELDLENFEFTEYTTYSVMDMSDPNAQPEEMTFELQSVDYDKKAQVLTASQKINLGSAAVGTISVKITNMVLDHKESFFEGEYKAAIRGDAVITTAISFDLGAYAGIPHSIPLGSTRILGLCDIALNMEYDIKGGVTATWTGELSAGASYSRTRGGFRMSSNFIKKSFDLNAHAEIQAGLKLSAKIDLPHFKVDAWATAGVRMYADITTHDSGTPKICVTISGYLYVNVGASAYINYLIDQESFFKQYDIYDEYNSPVRVKYHYEDDVLVPGCSRGLEVKYHTPTTSRYYNPYSNRSSYGGGTGSDGEIIEPVVIWEYTVDNNTATITKYNGNVTAVTIPSELDGYKVTGIAASAFKNNKNIKSLAMPNTIVNIASSSFSGCTALTSVVLSNAITKINDRVFDGCTSLTNIELSDKITAIERYAFCNCTSLADVTLPKNLSWMDSMAFMNCTAITSINIPRKLVNCGFYTYDGLFPQYGGPFLGCDNLHTVEFEKGVITIPTALFYKCKGLTEIDIPETVTSIGMYAFSWCENLVKVTGMKYVTSIDTFAFQNDAKLADIDLPSRLNSIGAGAFRNDTSLTKMTVPQTLKSVGYEYTIVGVGDGTAGVFGGDTIKEIYFEDGCTTVHNHICRNASALEKVHFVNTITAIGERAFSGCSSLKEVEIPDSVTYIGDSLFYDCTSLEKARLSNAVNYIGNSMFRNCSSLKNVEYPEIITQVGNYAFYGCENLQSIPLPNGLKEIGDWAFSICNALIEITVPETVISIKRSAFENCDKLQTVTINGSGSIGRGVFYDCDELEKVIISDRITSIGYDMCKGCENLKSVQFSQSITEMPEVSFRQCASLVEVKLPRFCKTILSRAFAEDVELTDVYMPASVSNIADDAFSYPSLMTFYGKKGSYAEEYAISQGITFKAIDAPITSIKYADNKISIGRNETVMPALNIEPKFDTDTVTFSSSDDTIATVADNGLVTSRWNYGTTTITATTGSGKSTSIDITVVKTADSISLDNTSLNLDLGTSGKLTATMSPSDAVDVLEWSSSNSDIAEVDQDGNITAKAKGTAVITVKASYSGVSATCTVTVIPPAEITAFTVDESENGYIANITTVDVPTGAAVWVAAYDTGNRLVGIQKVAANKAVQAEFDTPDAANFKAFVWNMTTLKPLAGSKEAPVTTGV